LSAEPSSYLLDTSAILWALGAPDKLSSSARVAIESGNLFVSVVSYWEAMVKSSKGALSIGDPVQWWHTACFELAATTLQLDAKHVSALRGLPSHHKDSFDRILIAQAVAEQLILVTSDEMVRKYPVASAW
jgi:PIN domain nuclease of toxin-antitoxin system